MVHGVWFMVSNAGLRMVEEKMVHAEVGFRRTLKRVCCFRFMVYSLWLMVCGSWGVVHGV